MANYPLIYLKKLSNLLLNLLDYLLLRDQLQLMNTNLSLIAERLDDINEQFFYYRKSQSHADPESTTFRGGNITTETKGSVDLQGGSDREEPSVFMQTDEELYELERLEQVKLKQGGVVTLEDDLEDTDIG